MQEIKNQNNSPFFQVYSVIQEGMSRPRVLNNNNELKPIFWVKSIIDNAGSFLKKGLKFFNGHNADNSTNNRPSLGHVVGSLKKIINGKLNQLVIGYFPDKDKVKNFDICSIEADVVLKEDDNCLHAKNIDNISGIALANSRNEQPGFQDAKRLASIQCFENNQTKNTEGVNMGENKVLTYEEFKNADFDWFIRAVRDKQIYPSQLGYTEKVLRQDNEFSKLFEDHDKTIKEHEELGKQLEEEKKSHDVFKKESEESTSKGRLEKLLPDTLTKKQRQYITTMFVPSKIEDLTDDGLKKYIDYSKDLYMKVAQVFGEKNDNGDSDNNTDVNDLDGNEKNKSYQESTTKDVVDEILQDIFDEKE